MQIFPFSFVLLLMLCLAAAPVPAQEEIVRKSDIVRLIGEKLQRTTCFGIQDDDGVIRRSSVGPQTSRGRLVTAS